MIITPLAMTMPNKKGVLSPSTLFPAFIINDNTLLGKSKKAFIKYDDKDIVEETIYWINEFGWCSVWVV